MVGAVGEMIKALANQKPHMVKRKLIPIKFLVILIGSYVHKG